MPANLRAFLLIELECFLCHKENNRIHNYSIVIPNLIGNPFQPRSTQSIRENKLVVISGQREIIKSKFLRNRSRVCARMTEGDYI